MISERDISDRTRVLRRQLEAKLGVKSTSLSQALKRAGRRLPRKLRGQGRVLVAAEQQAGNPKLARQINPVQLDKAFDDMTRHLNAIDVADVWWGRTLSVAGTIAGNLLVIAVCFVLWLWWRGHV